MKTKEYLIFCANDQHITSWNHLPDRNGEILFQCIECGRFLKYPAGTSRGKLAKLFIEQEKQNSGATPIESVPTASIVVSQVLAPEIKKSFWDVIKDAFNN